MFANLVWPSKLANVHPCYVFVIQIICESYIFSPLLANAPPQAKSCQTYPPLNLGGLVATDIYVCLWLWLCVCDYDRVAVCVTAYGWLCDRVRRRCKDCICNRLAYIYQIKSPPYLLKFEVFDSVGKYWKHILMRLAFCWQFRACSVSVAASGVFVHACLLIC